MSAVVVQQALRAVVVGHAQRHREEAWRVRYVCVRGRLPSPCLEITEIPGVGDRSCRPESLEAEPSEAEWSSPSLPAYGTTGVAELAATLMSAVDVHDSSSEPLVVGHTSTLTVKVPPATDRCGSGVATRIRVAEITEAPMRGRSMVPSGVARGRAVEGDRAHRRCRRTDRWRRRLGG